MTPPLDLDDLEAKARAAARGSHGPWVVGDRPWSSETIEFVPIWIDLPGGRRICDVPSYGQYGVGEIGHYLAAVPPDVVLALIERLRVAERDAARLDWIEEAIFYQNGGGHFCVGIRGDCSIGKAATFRDAIDRAIAERKGEP